MHPQLVAAYPSLNTQVHCICDRSKSVENFADKLAMRALSIRQPYAELILRGEKKVEYRSRPTRIIGERFYIYAAKKMAELTERELQALTQTLSQQDIENLPTGVIVGSAKISACIKVNGSYEWHLTEVKRYKHHRKVKRMPQPMWFYPF